MAVPFPIHRVCDFKTAFASRMFEVGRRNVQSSPRSDSLFLPSKTCNVSSRSVPASLSPSVTVTDPSEPDILSGRSSASHDLISRFVDTPVVTTPRSAEVFQQLRRVYSQDARDQPQVEDGD